MADRTTLSRQVRSTYFSYGGDFYEQRDSAAMGSPVPAVVANLYTELFEELALRSAPAKPRLWKRYVDDTCCIVKKGTVEGLLDHLNSVRPSIRFTVEVEKDGGRTVTLVPSSTLHLCLLQLTGMCRPPRHRHRRGDADLRW